MPPQFWEKDMVRYHVKGFDMDKLHPTSDQGTEEDNDSCSSSTLLLPQNALQQTIPTGGLGLPCCIYLLLEGKNTQFNKSSASLKELGSIPTDLLQVLVWGFFYPNQYGRRLLAKTIWHRKVTLVGLLSLGSTGRVQSSNSDRKGDFWETSLTYWVCLRQSIITLLTGNITPGRMWALQCPLFDNNYDGMKAWT